MRKFGVIFGLISLVLITSIGITIWSAVTDETVAKKKAMEQESVDFAKARQLLGEGRIQEANAVISKYQGLKWQDLHIRVLERENNTEEIAAIFNESKNSLTEHEDASLMLANSFIVSNQADEYASLRALWKGREIDESAWFLLDADYLLLQGRKKDAINFLKTHTIEGNDDVRRLTRLALLHAEENPKEAWQYLTQAYKIDPSNVDIRSYRARHLENAGKLDQAHTEYKAAVQLMPTDPYLRDQLAEFYIRHGRYSSALDIWGNNLSASSLDSAWEKAYFWNRMVRPIPFLWSKNSPPQGPLESLLSYYISLDDQFWNRDAFAHLEGGDKLLTTQQSTFWLRLLQSLKDKDEKETLHLLTYNPFAITSWNPELEKNLKFVLNYRKTPSPSSDITSNLSKEAIKALSNEPIGKNMHDLLLGDDIFVALLYSSGWSEAAFELNGNKTINSPSWLAYDLVRFVEKNHGAPEAIELALSQTPTPELKFHMGKMLIASGNYQEAIKILESLAHSEDSMGYDSTVLLGKLYIDMKEYQLAKDLIQKHPKISESTFGRETLARIALIEGDDEVAEQIYLSLETASPEARSYLAKKAYAEKNWQRARELTELLIKDYPDNKVLNDNLKRIVYEQKKQN